MKPKARSWVKKRDMDRRSLFIGKKQPSLEKIHLILRPNHLANRCAPGALKKIAYRMPTYPIQATGAA